MKQVEVHSSERTKQKSQQEQLKNIMCVYVSPTDDANKFLPSFIFFFSFSCCCVKPQTNAKLNQFSFYYYFEIGSLFRFVVVV